MRFHVQLAHSESDTSKRYVLISLSSTILYNSRTILLWMNYNVNFSSKLHDTQIFVLSLRFPSDFLKSVPPRSSIFCLFFPLSGSILLSGSEINSRSLFIFLSLCLLFYKLALDDRNCTHLQ